MALSAEDKQKLARFFKSALMNEEATTTTGFKNFMHTQEQDDAIVVNIQTRAALQTLMCEIQALNKNKKPEERIIVRAAAGGDYKDPHSASYSATNVANADIIIRLTGREFKKLVPTSTPNSMRVGASLQIGELDQMLYEKFKLVLPSSSLIPYVTAAGLASTGGHGTGKDQPSFAGLVNGMTLCLENGSIIHIDRTYEDFETILGANNGLFGIIIDLDIQCAPAYKMQCVMEKRSVCEFMEEVEKGLFQNDPYVSAMYVPTYLPDEMTNTLVNNVIIYRWRPVPLDTPDTNHNQLLSDLSQELQTKLGNTVDIPNIIRHYPSIVPFYMQHIASPLTIGKMDELAVGPWHEMMHYRTSFPRDLDEICGIFPVKDEPLNKPQGTEIVKALKHAISLLDEHAKRGQYPITYGMYFRYLQGTNGGLSFTAHPADHHVCAMDLTTNENAPGFAEFKAQMQAFFINEMQAKFHWGKNAPFDLDYKKLYGEELEKLKAVLETWHHDYHLSTQKSALLNPLFSTVLGYPVPSLVDQPETVDKLFVGAKKRQAAQDAKKLLAVVGNASQECKQLKEQVEADIKNNSRSTSTMFTRPPVVDGEEERKQSKWSCNIL